MIVVVVKNFSIKIKAPWRNFLAFTFRITITAAEWNEHYPKAHNNCQWCWWSVIKLETDVDGMIRKWGNRMDGVYSYGVVPLCVGL